MNSQSIESRLLGRWMEQASTEWLNVMGTLNTLQLGPDYTRRYIHTLGDNPALWHFNILLYYTTTLNDV
jgi:hypothetical protein